VPEDMKRMWDLLTRVSLQHEKPISPESLKAFLDSSGIAWEQKLRTMILNGQASRNHMETQIRQDLKGLALRALSENAIKGLISPETLETFVEELQQLQLLNLSTLEEKGKLLFFIPIMLDEKLKMAQLVIDFGGSKNGKEERGEGGALKLSVFLELSRLGPVRIDAVLCKEKIIIGFLVSDKNIQQLFDSYAGMLKKQLERHGFYVQQMTCRREKPHVLAETSFVPSLMDNDGPQISVVI